MTHLFTPQERVLLISLAVCLLTGVAVRLIKENFFNDTQDHIKLVAVSEEINELYAAAETTDDASSENSEPVNVNTADQSQLMRLPGIGPALASRILAERERIGSFETIEDLTSVKGIGTATLDRLKPYIAL